MTNVTKQGDDIANTYDGRHSFSVTTSYHNLSPQTLLAVTDQFAISTLSPFLTAEGVPLPFTLTVLALAPSAGLMVSL